MIDNYEKFINRGICPLCLERYLDNLSSSNINENVNFKVSSLQIVVPIKTCINDCKSCIAKLSNEHDFSDRSKEITFFSEYLEKMKKVRNTGCKSLVLTGVGEAIQNKKFLRRIGELNNMLNNPFEIEIQTTGVLLTDDNINFLKNDVGVKVISLSVFDIFDNNNNLNIIRVKDKLTYDVKDICNKVKRAGLINRLSLNLISVYDKHPMDELFKKILELNPDQLTFRSLWFTEDDNPINDWIKSNNCNPRLLNRIKTYLDTNADKMRENMYNFKGISILLNEDCMKTKETDTRYLILRPDVQLYQSWSDTTPIEV